MNRIFNVVKKIIPKISETELIALRSGTTSIDRHIFEGKVNLPKLISNDNKFDDNKVNTLLDKYSKWDIFPNNNNNTIVNYLGTNKFFSFIIDEKYDGYNLSVNELSNILTKITSVNPALGVTVMVPNSLGPGELLHHYGTQEQKDKYLPGLANGDYIPCFGLTGPNNGSDATGSIDEGILIEKDGKKYIEITINKRYITLAPVANLVGLAFRLKDPNNLLKEGKEGVTVALLEKNHEGLKQLTYHNPLNAGFPNGTLKGTFQIETDQIIGGEKNVGNGWKMLMECLAAGRGICLPATANASSKVSTFGILNYAKHRKQFNIPLIKMQGVQDKFIEMIYNTWLIQTSVKLTNTILDSGEKPAVISAIMKQQTTDRARTVLNNAMDIHAGGAICIGYTNFLEKFYRSAPIGITVEGSNTLTKNLIIFGQGLNKSHPFIYPILENILNDDKEGFSDNFKNIIKHSLSLYCKSLRYSLLSFVSLPLDSLLEKQTIYFANLSNFIALKGGAIKGEQFLSGDMADIFSNLYLAYSVKWYQENFNISQVLSDFCINKLLNENKIIINRVIDNYNFKLPLLHMKSKINYDNYADYSSLINEILNNQKIINDIKNDIYIKNTILEDLDKLNELEGNEYNELYNKVIQVDEFDIKPNNVVIEN